MKTNQNEATDYFFCVWVCLFAPAKFLLVKNDHIFVTVYP